MTSIYQDCVAAGVETSNHYSDLYIPVNETTRALIKKHGKTTAQVFRNNLDGKAWYDVPFAYDPYWESKQRAGVRS